MKNLISVYAEVNYETGEVWILDLRDKKEISKGKLPKIEQISKHDMKRFIADMVPEGYKLQAFRKRSE